MDNTYSLGDQIALKLIFSDMTFARRYIQGLIAHRRERQAHVLAFSMLRYLLIYT